MRDPMGQPAASDAPPDALAWSEAQRLAALARYEILDTPLEPFFDEIAELAAEICETPVAVVSFVAPDRHWFKAEKGVGRRDLPLGASKPPQAILQPGVLVAPDLATDPRFAGDPLVEAAPGLRFYAGARLETPEGLPLGAVCVLDHAPRPQGLSRQQTRALAGLARQVMSELELRRALKEREANAQRVALALAAGAIVGTWFWEIQADRFTIDEQFARSFGIDPSRIHDGLSLEEVIETVHPEDKQGLTAAINEAISRGGPYAHQYRVRRADGQYYWIEANGRVDHGEDGTPLAFPGVLIDREERRALQEERDRAMRLLETFTAAVPGVVYAKDRQGRMLIANRGTTELIGKPPEFYLGKTDAEFLDDKVQAQRVMANDRRVMETGLAEQLEEDVHFPDGTRAVWLSTKEPLRAEDGEVIGLIGSSVDITSWKKAEEARTLLMREVDHRARNALAVVQSMIRLTKADDADQLREALAGRIDALARAHASLAHSNWEGGLLSQVIAEEVASSGAPSRFRFDGPEVMLLAEQVQPVSMIIHELTTNAFKYGALGSPTGQIEISWRRAPTGWVLTWTEEGGPAVSPPQRTGFGSRLIQQLASQLEGEVSFSWRPAGLAVELVVPRSSAPS